MLAKDAAEILWEMVAMGESGGAVADMRGKAEQLQVSVEQQPSPGPALLPIHQLKPCWWLQAPKLSTARSDVVQQTSPFMCGLLRHFDLPAVASGVQAQLRGLINDYQGGDEAVYAHAFEAFDMLSRCLDELKAPQQAQQPAPAPGEAALPTLAPPPSGAAPVPAAAPDVAAPLISFE